MPRAKGRGAREQHRADRRATYASQVLPHLQAKLDEPPADARVLLVGDDLEQLAAALAPKVAQVALVAIEFERWDALTRQLASYANLQVVQELAELDDPDGFPTEPWTYGVMLLPYHLGTRETNTALQDLADRLVPNAPLYVGGSRTHDWGLAQERLAAIAAPLTTLYSVDPIRVVRGHIRSLAGITTNANL